MKSRGFSLKVLPAFFIGVSSLALSGCLKDDESTEDKYEAWKEQNLQYVRDEEGRTNEDGTPYYTRIAPSWAPDAYSLVHWYNDRKETENNLSPMDNSTVQITYELFDIEGELISNSFSNADSVYTSMPSQNIIGVWATLTHMNVGDSVGIVIPYKAGYGEIQNGNIKPYSTLVYNIKLKAIKAYEVQ